LLAFNLFGSGFLFSVEIIPGFFGVAVHLKGIYGKNDLIDNSVHERFDGAQRPRYYSFTGIRRLPAMNRLRVASAEQGRAGGPL
jgi:hypothetical protein